MKQLLVCAMVLLVGCSTTETVTVETTVRADIDTVQVPPVSVVLPAETSKDSLSIVTAPSEVGTIVVRPDIKGKTPEAVQEVKKAVAEIKKWDVQVDVQPPPVIHSESDSVETRTTTTKEVDVWDKLLELAPIMVLIVFGLVILFIVVRVR